MTKPLDIQAEVEKAERRLKAVGITIQDFCDRSGVSRASWWRWGSGKTIPNAVEWDRAMRLVDDLTKKAA